MDDEKLQEIHDGLVELAYQAGKMILEARPTMDSTDSKMNCTQRLHRFPHPHPNIPSAQTKRPRLAPQKQPWTS
jgi:hypothetical protein